MVLPDVGLLGDGRGAWEALWVEAGEALGWVAGVHPHPANKRSPALMPPRASRVANLTRRPHLSRPRLRWRTLYYAKRHHAKRGCREGLRDWRHFAKMRCGGTPRATWLSAGASPKCGMSPTGGRRPNGHENTVRPQLAWPAAAVSPWLSELFLTDVARWRRPCRCRRPYLPGDGGRSAGNEPVVALLRDLRGHRRNAPCPRAVPSTLTRSHSAPRYVGTRPPPPIVTNDDAAAPKFLGTTLPRHGWWLPTQVANASITRSKRAAPAGEREWPAAARSTGRTSL